MEDPIHSAVAFLPEVFFSVAPELAECGLPVEPRATCDDCRMCRRPGDAPASVSFDPDVGCCTFFPKLPNFLLGRILREGGEGAARVRALLADGEGDERGIAPGEDWRQRYDAGRMRQFGRTGFVRCPYLANPEGGGLHCTVWKNRGGVCRTWFCSHENGRSGASMWRDLKLLLLRIEAMLGNWVIQEGEAPPTGASPEALEAFYLRAAELVDGAGEGTLPPDALEKYRDAFHAAWSEIDDFDEVPEVLAASLTQWFVGEDDVIVHGYSAFDYARVPRSLWDFLSRLDGEKPWRVASEEAAFGEEPVLELLRVGALMMPTDDHVGELEGPRVRFRTNEGEWHVLDSET